MFKALLSILFSSLDLNSALAYEQGQNLNNSTVNSEFASFIPQLVITGVLVMGCYACYNYCSECDENDINNLNQLRHDLNVAEFIEMV